MKELKVAPTGECWCGCKSKTNDGSFFLAGHDKRAESMLTKLEYGWENAIVHRIANAGYGPGGKNLLTEFEKLQAAQNAGNMELSALHSLTDICRQPGIVEGVVFIAPAGVPWPPKTTHDGPEPKKTSVLEIPQRGSVVAQGFSRPLSEGEKEIVQARFPNRPFMWLANS
jgi:hypothetical protein